MDNSPQYIRHFYKIEKELKTYTVYKLVEEENNNIVLTQFLRIEKYWGKSNSSGIDECLRLRTKTSWKDSELITGLRPTNNEHLFYGDWLRNTKQFRRNKTLLLFLFSDDKKELIIDVYRGFYPIHKGVLHLITKTY